MLPPLDCDVLKQNPGTADHPDLRVYISIGIPVEKFAVYAALNDDDNVAAFWLLIDRTVAENPAE